MVSLSKKKRTKYLEKVVIWMAKNRVNLKEMESLIGTLNHVCLVVPLGQSHLPSLYASRVSFLLDQAVFYHINLL